MQAFVVELKNKPGELAKLAEAIGAKGINITGFTGAACGDTSSACLITNDEAATRRALQDAHYTSHERELVTASIQDRPGALAQVCRRLGDAGVNIEAALPTGMSGTDVHVAFVTDKPAEARSALGDLVVTGSTNR
jgi:hypothetical protein